MDRTVEETLDPNSYHSHISVLESSTDAIKIAAKHDNLTARKREARYYTTSTLISTALPAASIVRHRRNLAGDELPHTERQLSSIATSSVREQLLQAARSRPSAAEATAQATRLVDSMITRPQAQRRGSKQLLRQPNANPAAASSE